MSYLIIAILIIGGILWAIVSFFEWLGKTTTQVKARVTVDTSKTIVERNQDLIQTALDGIYNDTWPHYIENKVRDCIGEIAKREGRPELAPKYREWLSSWEKRVDIPAEYQQLKEYLRLFFHNRFTEKKAERQKQEDERHRAYQEERDGSGEKLLAANQDLVNKFLEIAERKVSTLDDYGDESWSALDKEIDACIEKIAIRNGVQINWQKYRAGLKKGYFSSSGSLPDDYQWLKGKLPEVFKEYHQVQKGRPVRDVKVDGLSGVEFEIWISKLLKENGFADVRGTPATGDQGADLIAKKDGKTIIIQAKRYQGTVGNKAVQEVISAVGFYGGDEGWVVTSSTFTPSAKALAQKMNTRLVDGHDLERFGENAVAVIN